MNKSRPNDDKIGVVNDKKLKLAERLLLVGYDELKFLINRHAHDCLFYHNDKIERCGICQIAIDFELV